MERESGKVEERERERFEKRMCQRSDKIKE
jgi:hypothetical protein